MSFDRDMLNPNPQTHIPVVVEVPAVDADVDLGGRAPIPPPTLWKRGVKAMHKLSGRVAIVTGVDLGTMQFRAYYPDEAKHGARTEWESCKEWAVQVTLRPEEQAKREAQKKLAKEVEQLDPRELAAVNALVDGDDPVKGLAKIQALRDLGILKGAPDVVAAAVAEEPKKARPKKAAATTEEAP